MDKLTVFDFDKTIYDGDSSIDIYIYSLKKNIWLIRFLPLQLYGLIMYKLKLKSKEYFKEKYFSFLKGIKDIDIEIQKFWQYNEKKIKYNMLKDKFNIVVISASPEFMLAPICDKIGVEKLIASKVEPTTGKFFSKNCYGQQKVVRLNEEYKNYVISEFYSDSTSDRYLAEIAEKSYIVKKDKIYDWNISNKG